jgi:hypothetical protein
MENDIKKKEVFYKKKVSIFGKGIPIMLLIGLVLIGGASAALVAYLSNTVQADVTVSSPIELEIGTAWNALGATPISFSIVGGESVEFYVSTHNLATLPITGTMYNVVSNPWGVSCSDFTSLTASVLHPDGTPWFPSGAIGCTAINAYSVRLISTPSEPWTWAAGHEDIADISATFATNALGTYTLTSYVKY